MPDSDVLRFEFQPEHDGTLSLRSAVFQALGAASMCWTEQPRGVFESDRAKAIGDALMAKIEEADLLYTAWTIIANAHGGDWSKATPEWKAAAERWRDQWHETLGTQRGEHDGAE